MPDERRYLQTKYKKKTCNPVFDETYVFQVNTPGKSSDISEKEKKSFKASPVTVSTERIYGLVVWRP